MNSQILKSSLLIVGMLLLAGVAFGQSVAMGSIVLEEVRDEYLQDGEQHQFILMVYPAGEVTIDLERVGDFGIDAYLTLRDERGTTIETDDDGGEGLNSRITRFLDAGRYSLEARDLGNNSAGSYRLSVRSGSNSGNRGGVSRGSIAPGQSQSVFISEGGTAELTLDLPRSTFLQIDLERGTQGGIDTYLTIYDPTGNVFASNDDGGDGFNSRLSQEFPPGRYLIEARDFGNNDAGEIIVSVQVVRGSSGAPSIGLNESRVVQVPVGGSAVLEFQTSTFVYLEVSATAQTNDVDPILVIHDAAGNQLERNDDGGSGLNSLISTQLNPGVYTFEVRDFGSNDNGPVEVGVFERTQ